ncbi:hypothetical protein G3I33_09325 [Streptomyces sp. SID9124]|nr:hypothetical protein [Streptomyces sp. SID9124]
MSAERGPAYGGACRPWLSAELHRVDPELVVVLGATAGRSVLGNSFKVTESRGTLLHLPVAELPTAAGPRRGGEGATRGLVATVHPSAVLRAPDRAEAYRGLVRDLRVAARFLE